MDSCLLTEGFVAYEAGEEVEPGKVVSLTTLGQALNGNAGPRLRALQSVAAEHGRMRGASAALDSGCERKRANECQKHHGDTVAVAFRSSDSFSSVKCTFKSSTGVLWPLSTSLVFGPRPLFRIELEDANVGRQGAAGLARARLTWT